MTTNQHVPHVHAPLDYTRILINVHPMVMHMGAHVFKGKFV
jgi:hypothetical protein